MLIVRDLGVEIGARRLLNPVSFTIGDGEKVGVVGRNGTGKSTLLSVLLGQQPEHLRVTGTVTRQGSLAHLPQEPVPGGLGVEPIGLSHVLSRARPRRPRRRRPARPSRAGRRSDRGDDRPFHRARDGLRRPWRLRGRVRGRATGRGSRPGRGPAVGGPRLALGGPAPARRPHAGPLRAARDDGARRADQPPRPRGQALALRRAGEVSRHGHRDQPRPAAAGPRDLARPRAARGTVARVQGELHQVPPARGGPAPQRGEARGDPGREDRPAEDPRGLHEGSDREARAAGQGPRPQGRAPEGRARRGDQARAQGDLPAARRPRAAGTSR